MIWLVLVQALVIAVLCYELRLKNKVIKRFEQFAVTVADSFENINDMVQQLEALHHLQQCLDEAQRPVERFH